MGVTNVTNITNVEQKSKQAALFVKGRRVILDPAAYKPKPAPPKPTANKRPPARGR
jgi:hypothetical protein